VTEYCRLWRELNVEYEEYSKSVGMTYSSLLVLSIIYNHPDDCMQKTICDESFLPKQTVNQIITSFYRKGFIRLAEVESDRRYKTIHLTDSGLEHAESKIPKIKDAENKAMDSLDEVRRAALLETTKLYISRFRDCMREEARSGGNPLAKKH
jgi:DNA-binding MarR family transcriptional regulator